MAGANDNLIPLNERTKEEQTRITKMGGKASGVARAKKKTIKELAKALGSMPITDPKKIAVLQKAGIADDDMIQDMAMLYGLEMKAQAGDTNASKLLMELRGEYSTRLEVEPVQPKPLIDLTEGKK